jgi:response regulator RpfG family c-di-GMP phosphodiesterase
MSGKPLFQPNVAAISTQEKAAARPTPSNGESANKAPNDNLASESLRVLFVEDTPQDVELSAAVIGRAGYNLAFDVVDTPTAFEQQLQRTAHDIVICDYNLRDWTAVDALDILKKSGVDIPFIAVSGSIGDEAAVDLIKRGATDYLLKDRVARLPAAIRHALEERQLRAERKRSEEQVKLQLQRLAALRAIDVAITSSLDIRVTLSVFLDQVTTQLGVDAADVFLFRPHTQMLEHAIARGFKSALGTRSYLPLGNDPASHAVLERRIISIPNLEEVRNRFAEAPSIQTEGFVSYLAVPLIAKGQVNGVLEIWQRQRLESNPDWLNFLEALAGQGAIAVDNAVLYQQLQASNSELIIAYDTTLEGWVKALDLRDNETEGHTRRVTELTTRLAYAYPFDNDQVMHIRRGALLHDIGKMAIPDAILHKPGPLTPEERAVMCRHTEYAYEWLFPIPYLRPALDIPYCHHERWDGSGYPRGLKGESIPLAARLFSVVDVWDALRSDRPYRASWPADKVIAHIRERQGQDFDPHIVEIFLKHMKDNG